MWISSAVSHLCLLDSVVRSEEKLCAGELHCLGHRRKSGALGLLYKIYHRANCPMHEYRHNFVAVRNTRASAALGKLALVILCCKTDQFSRSLLPIAVCMKLTEVGGVLSGGTSS